MADPVSITLVLLILAGAVYLFSTERFSVDFVAMMVLGALLVLALAPPHILTPDEVVSGFSNAATITVAAMFVLSAGLQRTGAVRSIANLMVRWGRFRLVLLLLVMVTVGAISAFINNTAAVAVFLPLVLAVCARRKFPASRFLIPLSFASQFGGVCTLIGTSTNLLVSNISERAGFGSFGMFEFTKLGLIMFAAGLVYFILVGYWLVPDRRGDQLTETYHLGEYISELRVMPRSPLVGKTAAQTKFGQHHDVTVLEILRENEKLWAPLNEPIREGDVLLVRGKVRDLMDLKTSERLEIEPAVKLKDELLEPADVVLVEALVAPRSTLIGQTLAGAEFRKHYNAIVLAIQRRGHTLREKLRSTQLEFGDALLLQGPKKEIDKLRADENFIMLEEVEEPSMRSAKVPLALAILALVVGLAALNVMPIMSSAILGCVALVLTRCITLEEAYRAIDWRVIFLLAGVLPLGIAMQKSGAAAFLAEAGLNLVGWLGPVAALGMLYLLTAALTECMSNNATAVLLAPIAISTATQLGTNPKPFLFAIMFAASTSFCTPVGYQTNTMVYSAGGYRFTDFVKVGLPLNLVFWVLAVIYIPRFWPF